MNDEPKILNSTTKPQQNMKINLFYAIFTTFRVATVTTK